MDIYTFYLRYIDLNLKSFDKIGIDFEINKFLLIFMLVIIASSIAISYNRWIIITTVKRLVRHEATSDSSAKTLGELGISSRGIKRALRSSGRLTRIVGRAGECSMSYEEYTKLIKSKKYTEEKIDFDKTRIYIREESIEEAKAISIKSDITVLSTLLLCVLIFAIFMCLFFLMPEILTLVNNLLGML